MKISLCNLLDLTAPQALAEEGAGGTAEFTQRAACCHERGDACAGFGLGSWTHPGPRYGTEMQQTENSWPEAGGGLGRKQGRGGGLACRTGVISNFVSSKLPQYMPETSLPF